jgi:hypothetical protein
MELHWGDSDHRTILVVKQLVLHRESSFEKRYDARDGADGIQLGPGEFSQRVQGESVGEL